MNIQDLIVEILDRARGMWRFRWTMILVAWIVALVGWTFVYRMPDVYQASARVAVDTNTLLPNLTEGLTVSEDVVDEVDLVSEAMLARPNLEAVAIATDLDLRAATPEQREILISNLKNDISVQGGRDNIFSINYADHDRAMAIEVVSSLLNTFMESSLGAQGDDTDVTERALRVELDDHEQRLDRAESDLAEFKKRNIGYMPDDGSDYYTQLQAAQAAVAKTERQVRQLRQRRDEIQRQLEGEEPVFGIMPSTPGQAAATCSRSPAIARLEAELSALRVEFTDKHPRIVTLNETIEALEQQCAEELAASGGFAPVLDSETQSLDANPVYQNLRLQLSTADVELVELQEELASDRARVNRLRADVDKIAEVEKELKRLNRDYEVVERRHQELLERWESLQSRKRLDPVTEDVQFNILEPPFASAYPVSPNRALLLLGVLVLSLGAGGAVAFVANELKPVFYSRRNVARFAGLPVIGSVSMIQTAEQRFARRLNLAGWSFTLVALVVTCAVFTVYDEAIGTTVRNLVGSA